jgi:hypothetical protein
VRGDSRPRLFVPAEAQRRSMPLFPQRRLKRENMTEKANRARAFGMVIGIVVLVIALLWKRLLR